MRIMWRKKRGENIDDCTESTEITTEITFMHNAHMHTHARTHSHQIQLNIRIVGMNTFMVENFHGCVTAMYYQYYLRIYFLRRQSMHAQRSTKIRHRRVIIIIFENNIFVVRQEPQK